MGVSTKVLVNIELDTQENADKVGDILKDFVKIVKKRFQGYAEVYDVEVMGTSVSCELCSSRQPNAEFQIEALVVLMKEAGITSENMEEFCADLIQTVDSYYFNDDSFEDAANDFLNKLDKKKLNKFNLLGL